MSYKIKKNDLKCCGNCVHFCKYEKQPVWYCQAGYCQEFNPKNVCVIWMFDNNSMKSRLIEGDKN